MPRIVVCGGSTWGYEEVDAIWGQEVAVTNALRSDLTALMVSRFELVCAKHGDPSVVWTPSDSQVSAEASGSTTSTCTYKMDAEFAELYQQVATEVHDALCGRPSPLAGVVLEIRNAHEINQR